MSLTIDDIRDAALIANAAYSNNGSSAQSNLTSIDLVNAGWQYVNPTSLGVDASLVSNGFFSYSTIFPHVVDAQAILAFNANTHTLAVAFRGSESKTDFLNDIEKDYGPEYQAFAQNLLTYVLNNAGTVFGATKILVAGHSLGGAMVEEVLGKNSDSRLVGVTFGSPGATDIPNAPGSDSRLLNIGHVDLNSVIPSANQGDIVFRVKSSQHIEGSDIRVDLPDQPDYTPAETVALALAGGDYGQHEPFRYIETANAIANELEKNAVNQHPFDVRAYSYVFGSGLIIGSQDDNVIIGKSGADTLIGLPGNDILDGGSGNDELFGGAGDDRLYGGDGTDTAVFVGARSSYHIYRNPNGDGSIVVAAVLPDATDGTDTLYSVEKAIFNNSSPVLVADLLPPELLSTFPSDNSTGVTVGANIILSFNEAVSAGSGSIVIHNANGSVFRTIAVGDTSQVTFSGSQVTINPSVDLVAGAGYYVTVAAGAIQDINGNAFDGISSSSTLNFTTASAPTDTTPPQLLSTSPADHSVGVSPSGNIVLNFSEIVVPGSGTIDIHNADGSLFRSISVLDGSQVHFSGGAVTIDPGVDLSAGANYYVTVGSGAIRDVAGNAFGGISSSDTLNFTTLSSPNTSSIFLSVLDNSIREGQSGTTTLAFGVVLSGAGAGSQAVSVQYATEDIVGASAPATAGQDYIATSGTLVIPAGQTSGEIDVKVFGDTQLEPDEVFRLTLSQPSTGVAFLNGRSFATGFIDNDDQAPNHIPVPGYDLAITAPGTPVLMDVLANDTDQDGDSLTIFETFSASGGTATIADNGHKVLFTPSAGFVGVGSFGYTVDDGHGGLRSQFLDQVMVSGDGSPGISNSGTPGNDVITGGGGNDTLSGGPGDDTIAGGPGSDRIDGGAGFNYLDLRQAAHAANLQFIDPWIWDDGDGGHDVLTNIEGVYGTPFDDQISGASGDIQHISTGYRFYGYDGNDFLRGDAGDDVLDGGAGNDTLIFGSGKDLVFGGPGDDQIYSFNGLSDTVGDTLDGGSGNDFIFSSDGASADLVYGRDGNDYLQFGNGDTLSGGAGSDVFFIGNHLGDIGSGGVGHATITDLSAGDTIGWFFPTSVIAPDGLSASNFFGPITPGNGASTGLDHVEYATAAGNTLLYFGYDANPGADFVLSIAGTVALSDLQVDSSDPNYLKIHVLDSSGAGPTDIALSNASVLENSANGTLVGSLSAADSDANATFSYTLLDDAGGRFAITGTNLVVAGALDYETARAYDVTVRVTDSASQTFDKTLNISLVDVNEGAPQITSNGGGATAAISVPENTTGAIATIAATDPDTAVALIYSISGGADQNAFIIDANTGALSFKEIPDFEAPSDADGNNSYIVQVSASDGTLSDTQTIAVSVSNVDEAPTNNGIVDQSLPEDHAWSFQLPANAFADVDSPTLSYTASLDNGDALPSWLSFDGATRTFAGTPPQDFNGAFSLKVVASDGSLTAFDTFTLTITPVNDAPVVAHAIADQSSPEDQAWSYQVPANTFSDVDSPTLAYTASLANGSALPAWLSFDAITRTFSGTPPQDFNGVIDLKVTASDGSLTVFDSFALNVTPVNDAPVVAHAITDQSSPEDQAWSFQVPANTFADVDGPTLSYTATLSNGNPLPAWLSFDPATRTFGGTPPQDFNGAVVLKVTASDGSLTVSNAFTLNITPVNDAPVAAHAIADQNSPEDQTWSFQVPANTFTDVDGPTLSYAATLSNGNALPAWLSFDAPTRTFGGTPPLDFNGAVGLKVTASDGSLTVSSTFTLNVTPVNDAPVVAHAIADQVSPENQAWSFQIPGNTFTDVDSPTLNYAATLSNGNALPAWLSFDATTRTFAGTPPQDFNGALGLTVTASDGSLTASDTFTLNIAPMTDLSAATLSVSGTSVTYRISNGSLSAAAASLTGIYLSTDNSITTSDTLLATLQTPSLAGGASDTESPVVSLPSNLAPGTYFVGAIADYNGQIAETNEANNASNAIPVILGNASDNTLVGTAGNDTIIGFSGNDTLTGGAGNDMIYGDGGATAPSGDITATVQGTVLQFSGSGFDATRVQDATVVKTGSVYEMLYGGLPFANNYQIGLATSSDGTTWSRYSSSPVISNGGSQSWASFRELPATLMYEGGTYKLWFNGDNTNLEGDPGRINGFGYATSPDGVHWAFDADNPIRGEVNGPQGDGFNLQEVVKLGGQYHAYFIHRLPSGDVLEHASSSDGAHFSGDTPVGIGSGYSFLAATTVTFGGVDSVFAALQKAGVDYYGISTDGVNFTIGGTIDVPSNFGINDILFDNGLIKLYSGVGVGNVNWSFGNSVIQYATAAIPISDLELGGNDTLTGGAGNDTIVGGSGIDTAIYSGNHSDYTISYNAGTQTFSVRDLRTGSPDGVDSVSGVELFQFADGTAGYDSAGRLASWTITDSANMAGWSSFRTDYDTAGNVLSQAGINDGGSSWANVYDVANVFGWSRYTSVSDAAGNLVSKTQTNDDGTHSLTAFDTTNTQSWSTFTITYDANWNLTSLTGTNDDGTHTLNANKIWAYMDTLTWYANPHVASLSGTPESGTTLTIQPGPEGQDLWVTNVFSYDDNYGVDDQQLKVGGWGDLYYSLLKFDTPAGVAVSQVASATLRLYDQQYSDYTPTGMFVDEVHTAWDENYGWYDHALSYTNIASTPTPPVGWIDIDVTTAVKDWLTDPSSNQGLQLRPMGNNHNLDDFVSSDATGALAQYRPELVIQTAPPPPHGLPVILDLDGNGVDVVPLAASSARFDMDGGGGRQHTAWAGTNDGFLAIDLGPGGAAGPDGVIDQTREINFTQWAPDASSDMAALREAFDTNANGWLDPGDARWSEFCIWQDANGDGISQAGEVRTLADRGISAISLMPTGPVQTLPDGSMIQGVSSFTKLDGTSGIAGDVALAFNLGPLQPVSGPLQADKADGIAGADMLGLGNGIAGLSTDTAPAPGAAFDGSTIDTDVARFVQAMAAYQVGNPGAIDMPTSSPGSSDPMPQAMLGVPIYLHAA